jgi:uncharacterized membrane protein YebE (DUF533 family)
MADSTKALDALMGADAVPRQSGSEGVATKTGAPAGTRRPEPPRRDAEGQTLEGGFASVIRAVLGQAASGLKDAARDIDARTDVARKANEALTRATGGRDVDDLLAQARELASRNQLATGAAIGGLASLLLGTGAGRSIAATTAKLGGLAVIGGLAYKAFQNYQAGKSLIDLGERLEPAPPESPFGNTTDAERDRRTAMLLVRSMIAAASADGAVDNAERRSIVGGLEQAGIDADAVALLDQEFARPVSIEALIAEASSPEIAMQAYTAARLAVEPDQPSEQQFLAHLAAGLKLQPELVRNIDAAAQKAAQQG